MTEVIDFCWFCPLVKCAAIRSRSAALRAPSMLGKCRSDTVPIRCTYRRAIRKSVQRSYVSIQLAPTAGSPNVLSPFRKDHICIPSSLASFCPRNSDHSIFVQLSAPSGSLKQSGSQWIATVKIWGDNRFGTKCRMSHRQHRWPN